MNGNGYVEVSLIKEDKMKSKIIFVMLIIVVIGLASSGCIENTKKPVTNQTYKVNVTQSDGSDFLLYYVLFMNNNGGYSYAIQDSKSSTGYVAITDAEVSAIQKSGGTITEEEYSSFIAPGEDVIVPADEIDEANAESSSDSSSSDSSSSDSSSDSSASDSSGVDAGAADGGGGGD